MKYISFLNKDFLLFDLQSNRFLLQDHSDELESKNKLIKIAEYALKNYPDEVYEAVAFENEMLLYLKHNDLGSVLKNLEKATITLNESDSNTYQVPVVFDGADWEEVEKQTKLSKKKIINRILNQEYTFKQYGFRPGFFYLDGLDKKLFCARKSTPSKNIQKGSVALGGEYIGIYNLASPAGWQVIGTIEEKLNELLPKLIKIGDKIKFTEHE